MIDTKVIAYIAIWIFFSSSTIIFNKWILSEGDFPYPIILTTWHMFFASIGTTFLLKTTDLLTSMKDLTLNTELYTKKIIPIAAFFAASLIFSNKAYLYISVSFIQMLKASTPVVVLVFSFLTGLEKPSGVLFAIVLAVSTGVSLASYGEINFVLIGVIYQILGILSESIRLILVQILLSASGLKLDPLSGLFLYAPVCFVFNLTMFLIFEYPTFDSSRLQEPIFLFILLLNAAVAFCLNISVVVLIKNTSSLVFTLSGVIKDILLIVFSTLIFKTPVSALQTFGYATALSGIGVFNLIKLNKPLDLQTVSFTILSITLGCLIVFSCLGYYTSSFDVTSNLKW
jgi:drug/metabolite transporter (DMT)-like permease